MNMLPEAPKIKIALFPRALCLGLALLSAPFTASSAAHAQGFPSRPVRVIVPYAPGGGNDIFARLVGAKLSEEWGYQVVIENRSGAGGNIGAEAAARSQADGYTLLMANNAFTINPYVYKNLSFDVVRDFQPISLVVTSPMLVAVNKDVPVKSIEDLVAFARKNPGVLNYGTPGAGTPQHLATELFKSLTETDLVHVPYQGTGPSVTGLLRNDVNVMFATPASVEQHVRSGALRAIGVTSAARTGTFPDVPTLTEAGVRDYAVEIWWGLVAPAGVPGDIVRILSASIAKAVANDDVKAKIVSQGAEPRTTSPEEFKALIESDLKRWKEVVARAKIAPP